MTRRTLAQWSQDWPYRVRPFPASDGVMHVTPDTCDAAPGLRAEAWYLSDAIVSSVQGGSIWFTTDPERVARRQASERVQVDTLAAELAGHYDDPDR